MLIDSDGEEDYSNISKYKIGMHKEIFDLCYFSDGAFEWNSVYFDMPINLRRFYLNVLQDTKQKEDKAAKDASKGSGKTPGQLPKGPSIKPGKISAKGPNVTMPKVRK